MTIIFQSLNSHWIRAIVIAITLLTTSLTIQAEERKVGLQTITVTATGESQAAPDMAIINLAIITKDKTAQKALAANNKSMNDVINAFKNNGISANDLQTSDLSIYQSSLDGTQDKNGKENLYNVSNFLTARIRDLSNVGKIFDQAMALGVNAVNGIIFTNSDTKLFYQEARKNAIAEAIEKARTIAQAANLKLGKIIEITESEGNNNPTPRFLMSAAKSSSETNFLSGEMNYNVNVTVVFAID
ncbi:SIMPL domain-containing protein [Bartonella sp. B41]